MLEGTSLGINAVSLLYRRPGVTSNAERRTSACGEQIFIIQASLELHMIDESGEARVSISGSESPRESLTNKSRN